jgi:D-alanyl-D-alanine carboxypeptidase/D-alanyl-D-alanine-endopeptidase (penicillin-binding protein 4)
VAVGVAHRIVFARAGRVARIPASNQKLLLSMAALATFGVEHRFATTALADGPVRRGVLHGDLWIVGGGDPELGPAALTNLARRLVGAGLRRVRGRVVGDRSAFSRGWWAPGWIPGLSRRYVGRPTALAFEGNVGSSVPELEAATFVVEALERLGVEVDGPPSQGNAPDSLRPITGVRSAPLAEILDRQNRSSINFDAEMLTKALGAFDPTGSGTTADGAHVIEAWALDRGINAEAHDGSGLSHSDRVSAVGLVTLLLDVARRAWGPALRASLPAPGEGTLAGRLGGVRVRAKTGTLFVTPVSALSGYVRAASDRWVAFSILTRGLPEGNAVAIEDGIVRTLAVARIG